MARLIPAKCPQCAAGVNVDPDHDVVRCEYCGTTSFIDRPKRQAAPPPNMPVVHLPQQPSAGSSVGAILIVVSIVTMVAVGAVFGMSRSRSNTPPRTTAPAKAPKPTVAPKREPRIHIAMGAPIAADVDGNGSQELIVRIRKDGTTAHAAYDPRTGKFLWTTEAPGLGHSVKSIVASDRLFAADDKGQVTAYLLRDGKQQWTTSLGEKLQSFCEGQDGALRVITAAKEVKRIDAASGGQTTETSGECKMIKASGTSMSPGMSDPRDRRDYDAPPEVDGYHCGSVRVTGSANYFVPDRCQKEGIAYDALDGMGVDRIWRDGDGFIVLGYKRPGTRTPMVARAKARSSKPEWSAVVPTGNPLDATPGAPTAATIVGDLLVVAWSKGVTAFDKKTGERRWSTEGSAGELIGAGDRIAVWNRTNMRVLDAKTGKVTGRLGI